MNKKIIIFMYFLIVLLGISLGLNAYQLYKTNEINKEFNEIINNLKKENEKINTNRKDLSFEGLSGEFNTFENFKNGFEMLHRGNILDEDNFLDLKIEDSLPDIKENSVQRFTKSYIINGKTLQYSINAQNNTLEGNFYTNNKELDLEIKSKFKELNIEIRKDGNNSKFITSGDNLNKIIGIFESMVSGNITSNKPSSNNSEKNILEEDGIIF